MKTAFLRVGSELVVIVAGVLIALGINEWRGNIKDADTEAQYLQQLLVDLQTTIDLVTSAVAEEVDSEAATKRLMAQFETDKSADPESVSGMISLACAFTNPVPVLGTVDALVSTGELRLIRDPGRRSRITRYLSQTRDYWLIPLYHEESLCSSSCARIRAIAAMHGIQMAPRKGPQRKKIEPDVEGFLANAEAYFEVTQLARQRGYFAAYEKAISNEAMELQRALTNESDPEHPEG
ncbi:MAG: hypothetical protein ACRC6L_00510 [Steroidobacteraceae bacterium]